MKLFGPIDALAEVLSKRALTSARMVMSSTAVTFPPTLAVATPLLVTSSLAYAKLCYRSLKECPTWDNLGWVTLSLGYIMLLNALVIMLYTGGYWAASWWFVGAIVALFVIYSVLDILASRKRLVEKLWKLGFYLALMFCGSVLPMVAGWV